MIADVLEVFPGIAWRALYPGEFLILWREARIRRAKRKYEAIAAASAPYMKPDGLAKLLED